MSTDVPVTHADAAETVRSHLVGLRGGASFLSPSDSALLLQWLDAGVGVPTILRALEVAAARRRARRSRVPLSLVHAKRHVKPVQSTPVLAAEPGTHPLVHIAADAARLGETQHAPALVALATQLLALPISEPEDLATQAIHHIGQAILAAWRDLSPEARERYHARAREELGDLVQILDEARLAAMLEEHARGLFRDAFPGLDAAAVIHEVMR